MIKSLLTGVINKFGSKIIYFSVDKSFVIFDFIYKLKKEKKTMSQTQILRSVNKRDLNILKDEILTDKNSSE